MGTFTLDSDIRSGVTIPIFFIVILAALLRRYLATVLGTGAAVKPNLEDVQKTQLVSRARVLRMHAGLIPLQSFVSRKAYFSKPDGGVLCNPKAAPNPLQAMAASQSDPNAVFSMLKNQVVFIFLSGGMGYLISFLFSGFLVAKAPFPLSYKFKSMLQRGVDVPGLDVNFVSSLSWYFFVLLSCTPLLAIIHHFLNDDGLEQDPGAGLGGMMMMPGMGGPGIMGGGGGGMPGIGGPDMCAAFNAEREALDLTVHRSSMESVKLQAIKRLELPLTHMTKSKSD